MGRLSMVDSGGAGCLLPSPVHAPQPDPGCAPCSRPGALGVYFCCRPPTLGSSGRPRTGLPQRNVQEGGGGAAILTTEKTC